MKFTGIIRRVDELGRVVIPKEIRRTLKMREGDAVELWVDNDCVCFKKYETNILESTVACLEDIVNDMWGSEFELRGKLLPHIQGIKDLLKEREME